MSSDSLLIGTSFVRFVFLFTVKPQKKNVLAYFLLSFTFLMDVDDAECDHRFMVRPISQLVVMQRYTSTSHIIIINTHVHFLNLLIVLLIIMYRRYTHLCGFFKRKFVYTALFIKWNVKEGMHMILSWGQVHACTNSIVCCSVVRYSLSCLYIYISTYNNFSFLYAL